MDKEVRLTLEMAELPTWLRLLPLGAVELVDNRPPFEVDPQSLADMVRAFGNRGTELVIDYEHQSLKGGQAPAAGWIKDLEAREDGLWAWVEWLDQAKDYLSRREYRYFSPVLRLDPETRRPLELMQVALTNTPAIRGLKPLVATWGGEAAARGLPGREEPEGIKDKAHPLELSPLPVQDEAGGALAVLKARLGLTGEAEAMAVWGRTLGFFQALSQELGLPAEATLTQIQGALELLKRGSAQAQGLQEEVAALRARLEDEGARRTVEEALLAGKITPAQKSWALSLCRQDPASFRTYVAQAPKVVPVGERLHLEEETGPEKSGLAPEELALCQALNLSPAAYLQSKAKLTQTKKGGETKWRL